MSVVALIAATAQATPQMINTAALTTRQILPHFPEGGLEGGPEGGGAKAGIVRCLPLAGVLFQTVLSRFP